MPTAPDAVTPAYTPATPTAPTSVQGAAPGNAPTAPAAVTAAGGSGGTPAAPATVAPVSPGNAPTAPGGVLGAAPGNAPDAPGSVTPVDPSGPVPSDAVRTIPQTLTTEQQNQVQANIGLDGGIANLWVNGLSASLLDIWNGDEGEASRSLSLDTTEIGFRRSAAAQLVIQPTGIDSGSGLRTLLIPFENGTLALTSDARFTDARTPTAHASSHAVGGSDSLDEIKSASFTAVAGRTYYCTAALTITDPSTTVEGSAFIVHVLAPTGFVTMGGENFYQSQIPFTRVYIGGAWRNPAPALTGFLSANGGLTVGGSVSINSTVITFGTGAAAAMLTALGAAPALPVLSKITFCGDSITDASSSKSTGNFPVYTQTSFIGRTVSALGYSILSARNPNPIAANVAFPELDHGYSGQTADGYYNTVALPIGAATLTPIQNALNAAGDAYVLLIGTNDYAQTSGEITIRIEKIVNRLRMTGKPVFVGELLPRTRSDDPTGTIQAKFDKVNENLVRVCKSNGATLIPWSTGMKSAAGLPNTNFFTIEDYGGGVTGYLHPNVAGHSYMASVLTEILRPFAPAEFALPAEGSARWLTANPYMANPGNTTATNFLQQNWTSPTKYTAPDGKVWQQLYKDTGQTNLRFYCGPGSSSAIPKATIDALIAAQTPCRMSCRYEVIDGDFGGFGVETIIANSAWTTLKAADVCLPTGYSGRMQITGGLFLSEEFTFPATAEIIVPKLSVYGAGTIRVRQFGVFTA